MSTQIISFNCVLKNKAGVLISSTFNREVINALEASTTFLKGLVLGLQNLKKGEKRTIALNAEEAYGFYDPKKVILLPRKKFSRDTDLTVGSPVSMKSKSGKTCFYRVVNIYGDMVTLDGNHPLAGQDLIFDIEATEVRMATKDEILESTNSLTTQHLH